MAASKRSKKRQPKKEAFLAAYAKCGNLSRAAKLAGCNRNQHYRWLEEPAYSEAFDAAHEQACDGLEEEARRRAVKGTLKPVYQGGERVGVIRQFSDTLLIFLMKGAMPEKYRERMDVKGTVDTTSKVQIVQDDDWYQNANRLAACGTGASDPGAAESGTVQGSPVRKTMGKNGNGSNGNGNGARS